MVVELVGDPVRYRARVYGTAVVALRGLDLTGRFLDDPDALPAAMRPAFLATYAEATSARQPITHLVTYRRPPDMAEEWQHNRVIMPFTRGGVGSVGILLVAIIPVDFNPDDASA